MQRLPVSSRLAVTGVVLLMLAVAPFAFYAVTRGLLYTDTAERATSRFFSADAKAASGALYLHMITGGIITVLAPVQMLRSLRDRWPVVHRLSGYVIAAAAGLTGLGGLFYIFQRGTIGGGIMSLGFGLYGVLMLICAVNTVRSARARDPRHSLWAGRLIILVLASWVYRVHYGLWEIATGGIGSTPSFSGPFDLVQVFAFYLPYLAIYEIWWRTGRMRGAAFKLRP